MINNLGVKLPYLKKPKAFCSGAYGHTIYSLKEAKVQCIADPNCDAIHDEDCLGRYLSLCPSSFIEMTSKASCLHIKQGIFHDWKYVNTHFLLYDVVYCAFNNGNSYCTAIDIGINKEEIDENYYFEVLENLTIEESSQSGNNEKFLENII